MPARGRSVLVNRRAMLRGGAGLVALNLAAPALALLDERALQQLLGRSLGADLKQVLPGEALAVAQVVADLARLEQEARLRRLPPTPLAFEGRIPTDPERLYEAVMPRLVALVDRSEAISPEFADKAGALLARLHQTQHVIAEALAQLPTEAGLLRRILPFAEQAQPGPVLSLPAPRAEEVRPPPEPESAPALEGEPAVEPSPSTSLPSVSRSLRYADLRDEYVAWFAALELREEYRQSTDWHLALMRQARSRYAAVGQRTGVPWYFIAAIHGLEASFNFRAHLHNGDFPLLRRTRQVPAGRPLVWLPPSDWESSALDALRLLGFAGQSDWSLPRTLYRLEAYNGFGYRRRGLATPYLWSFSHHYTRGKFVADGRFDPNARSQQCGAAVMLKLLEMAGELSA